MTQELQLSLKELYYLGKQMGGTCIDYSYLSRMEDIEKDYLVYKQETKASLVRKGVLWEDFSGNLEMDPGSIHLLHPLFFGDREAAVCTARFVEKKQFTSSCRWHFENARGVMCEENRSGLYLSAAQRERTEAFLNTMFSTVTDPKPETESRRIENTCIDRIVSIKSYDSAHGNQVKSYVEANGYLYAIGRHHRLTPIRQKNFIQDAMQIIWR